MREMAKFQEDRSQKCNETKRVKQGKRKRRDGKGGGINLGEMTRFQKERSQKFNETKRVKQGKKHLI